MVISLTNILLIIRNGEGGKTSKAIIRGIGQNILRITALNVSVFNHGLITRETGTEIGII